jgi:hypothetical protein
MANLNIEMPDDLARSLEGIAAAQSKSVQQLALARLSLLVGVPEPGAARIASPGPAGDAGTTLPNC